MQAQPGLEGTKALTSQRSLKPEYLWTTLTEDQQASVFQQLIRICQRIASAQQAETGVSSDEP